MKHSKFIQLVLDMRSAQKCYFASRGTPTAKNYLRIAIELENKVDGALKEIDTNCNFNHYIKASPLKNISPLNHEQPNQHTTAGGTAPAQTDPDQRILMPKRTLPPIL